MLIFRCFGSVQDKIHLVLTHSHRDHINGISYIFPYFRQVKEIILPFYFNEVWLIAQAIMNLRGMKNTFDCEDLKKNLIDIFTLQRLLKNFLATASQKTDEREEDWEEKSPIKVTFAYEGLSRCAHIHFLNPPIPEVPLNWLSDDQFKMLQEQIPQLFEEDFARHLLGYIHAQQRSYGVDHDFNRDFITDDSVNNTAEAEYRRMLNMGRAGCKMVVGFIQSNADRMRVFNETPNKRRLNAIMTNYIKTTHDACLVMRLINGGKTYLLSGDASKKVFNRLIGKDNMSIRADIFKIPHHGSEKNLDDKILRAVDPQIAIISHGNARFGTAKDTHPNEKVLNLFSNSPITLLVTNDVVKNGVLKLRKIKYCTHDLEIE